MAATTSDGGKGKNKTVLRPGDKGTKMVKQEVPFGGVGKAVVGVAVKAAKAIKTAQAVKKLAPEEKYAVKMVKNIQKTGKPGDVQKTLDKLPPKTKQDIAKALKKAKGSAPVKSRAPKATPDLMKVRNRRTGELKNFKPQ